MYNNAKSTMLFAASAIIMLALLQSNHLWAAESRWATVCWEMITRKDYWHPYLLDGPYYDKPLLSYWLIVFFSFIFNNLNEWALRLPSALAAISAVYCTYLLGRNLFNQRTGIIVGWILITNYFFIFWGRTTSADMLNVAGTIWAIYWYFTHKNSLTFANYLAFFSITAITSLCKGLVGFVIPIIAILPDLMTANQWKKHLNWNIVLAFLAGALIYLAPFMLSAYFIDQNTSPISGLYQVFHENILRFFSPFDHKDPIYTYLLYLPLYSLPWIILLIPAAKNKLLNWQALTPNQKWLIIAILLLLLFLTASGSRRTYYALPLLPLIALLCATIIDVLANLKTRYITAFKIITIASYIALFLWYCVIQPYYNQRNQGVWKFTSELKEIIKQPQNNNKQLLVIGSGDSSIVFYLKPQQKISSLSIEQFITTFSQNQFLLKNTILITTKRYMPPIKALLNGKNCKTIEEIGNTEKEYVAVFNCEL